MKVYVLFPSIYHFGIIRNEQCQCCEGIWDVAYEKEKHGMGLQRILRSTTAQSNGPRVFSTDAHSREPLSHVRHHFYEDQQIGKTGHTGQENMLVR